MSDQKLYSQVHGNACLGDGAEVFRTDHWATVNWSCQILTLYRTAGGGHAVLAGCQYTTLDADWGALADEHEWDTGGDWRSLQAYLRGIADRWKTGERQ